jgi:threonine dehydratase
MTTVPPSLAISPMPITIDQIRRAADVICGHVVDTPCLHSRTLSRVTGAHIFLKFENLQFTASFKERGALNKLQGLNDVQRRAGVIAASAGNHAQGVAYHAQRLGIPAVIVMPRSTPGVKIEHTREYGAEVILHGELFDEARTHALRLAEERRLIWIHPYDDERIIAGQGTIALEMLRAQPTLDTIVVPIRGTFSRKTCGTRALGRQHRPSHAGGHHRARHDSHGPFDTAHC